MPSDDGPADVCLRFKQFGLGDDYLVRIVPDAASARAGQIYQALLMAFAKFGFDAGQDAEDFARRVQQDLLATMMCSDDTPVN